MFEAVIVRRSLSRLPDGSMKSNLGDLLRCTILLECLPTNSVWVTDPPGRELLRHFIDPARLRTEQDLGEPLIARDIYYLDSLPVSATLDRSLCGQWRAFGRSGEPKEASALLAMTIPYATRHPDISWQEALVRGCGFNWWEQDYAHPLRRLEPTTDVGLNCDVHPAWPAKAWPRAHWERFAALCEEQFAVTWQEGGANISRYIEWLQSVRVVVTCETLGVHLASALRRPVVAILGPVEGNEYPYGRITRLRPAPRECLPCNAPVCRARSHCLIEVEPEAVYGAVNAVLQSAPNPC